MSPRRLKTFYVLAEEVKNSLRRSKSFFACFQSGLSNTRAVQLGVLEDTLETSLSFTSEQLLRAGRVLCLLAAFSHLPDVNPSAVAAFMAMFCNQTQITAGQCVESRLLSTSVLGESSTPRCLRRRSRNLWGLFLVREPTDE